MGFADSIIQQLKAQMPIPPSDDEYFNSIVKEILEVGTGQKGDPEDKWVTIGDLKDAGLVSYLNDQEVSVTRPDSAVQTSEQPEPPRDLKLIKVSDSTRISAMSHHLIWTVPNDDTISHFEVWVNTSNDRSTANKKGIITYPTNFYVHQNPKPAQNYYYWIRSVNWAGNYSTWEPSGVTNGYEVKESESIDDSIAKIVEILKGQTPATYSGATTYQIGDQVKYTCEDGNTRSYQCVKDENNLISNGKFATTELGSELITTQADRDFSSASNWTNNDIGTYDESGDLSITASAVSQWCYLDSANAAMTPGKLYRLTFDVDTLTSGWKITDDNGSFLIIAAVVTGANSIDFVYTGTGDGGFRIIATSSSASANFDNFSLKEINFGTWAEGDGWTPGYEGGVLTQQAYCNGNQIADSDLEQSYAFTTSTDYIVQFTISDYQAGTITPRIHGTAGTARSANGIFVETITAGASGGLELRANSTFIGRIDNVAVSLASGGSGLTGFDPELGYPTWWKRIGILCTGEVNGINTVAIDGNLAVDGTILARHIKGDDFGTLAITSGKLELSTTDAIEIKAGGNIKVLSGGDIKMYTEDHDNPALILFPANTFTGAIGGTDLDRLCIYSHDGDGNGDFRIGWDLDLQPARFYTIAVGAKASNMMQAEWTPGNYKSYVQCQSSATANNIILQAGQSTYYSQIYVYASNSESKLRLKGPMTEPYESSGTHDFGNATKYWGDVSYKTLTDRGCLGWFDDGVELQDGSIVSDLEALKAINKDERPGRITVYGKPMLDYRTLPKAVYKPADERGKLLPRDENDEPYNFDEDGNKIPAQDGAETTALISIMIGAIKELNSRLEKLEGINVT